MDRFLPAVFLALALAAVLASCGGQHQSAASRLNAQAAKSFEESDRQAKQEGKTGPSQGGQTSFEVVATALPVRMPPLPIQQYLLGRGHQIVARPAAKDFFCGHDVRARRLAVQAFYRQADKRFRARGISDFSLVIAPNSASIDYLGALAVARAGRVRLTRRGQAPGRC